MPVHLCQINTLPSESSCQHFPLSKLPTTSTLTFAAANHKTLVGATKPASYNILAADMAAILLNHVARDYVTELGLAVRLVDKEEPRVLADAHRRGRRLEIPIVLELPGPKVVHVHRLQGIHGDKPLPIRR